MSEEELEPINFVQAADILEDVKDRLAESMVDRLIESLARADLDEDIPDEVKNASREAFSHSGFHGFATSGLDPHEHHTSAASAHHKAAAIAKKHGLVKLAHTHQKKALSHAKQAKAAADESAGYPAVSSGQ